MTWIKTLRMDEDELVKRAIEAERKLYPRNIAHPLQRWTAAKKTASRRRIR